MLEQFLGAPTEYDALAKTFMKYKLLSDVGDMAFKAVLPKNQDEKLNTRLKQLQVYQMEKGFGIPDSQKFEDAINNEQWDTAKYLSSRGGLKYLDEMSDWRPTMPSGKMSFDVDQELAKRMMKTMMPGGENFVAPTMNQWIQAANRAAAVKRNQTPIFTSLKRLFKRP